MLSLKDGSGRNGRRSDKKGRSMQQQARDARWRLWQMPRKLNGC